MALLCAMMSEKTRREYLRTSRIINKTTEKHKRNVNKTKHIKLGKKTEKTKHQSKHTKTTRKYTKILRDYENYEKTIKQNIT